MTPEKGELQHYNSYTTHVMKKTECIFELSIHVASSFRYLSALRTEISCKYTPASHNNGSARVAPPTQAGNAPNHSPPPATAFHPFLFVRAVHIDAQASRRVRRQWHLGRLFWYIVPGTGSHAPRTISKSWNQDRHFPPRRTTKERGTARSAGADPFPWQYFAAAPL